MCDCALRSRQRLLEAAADAAEPAPSVPVRHDGPRVIVEPSPLKRQPLPTVGHPDCECGPCRSGQAALCTACGE